MIEIFSKFKLNVNNTQIKVLFCFDCCFNSTLRHTFAIIR